MSDLHKATQIIGGRTKTQRSPPLLKEAFLGVHTLRKCRESNLKEGYLLGHRLERYTEATLHGLLLHAEGLHMLVGDEACRNWEAFEK